MNDSTKLTIALAAAGVVAFVLYRSGGALARKIAPGNATNAAGQRVTAYEGAGAVGAAAAAANAASGGWLATIGEWVGGAAAAITGADRDAEVRAMLRGNAARYERPPTTSGYSAANDYGLGSLPAEVYPEFAFRRAYENDPEQFGFAP